MRVHPRPDTLNYKREGRWHSISSEDFLLRVRSVVHLERRRNHNILSHELQGRIKGRVRDADVLIHLEPEDVEHAGGERESGA